MTRNLLSKLAGMALLAGTLMVGLGADAATANKPTMINQIVSTPIVVHEGQTILLAAQLYYKNPQHNWRWEVRSKKELQFWSDNQPFASIITDGNGWARYYWTVPKGFCGRRNSVKVNWTAYFPGEVEYQWCYRNASFTVVK